jgi:hypothetical protein
MFQQEASDPPELAEVPGRLLDCPAWPAGLLLGLSKWTPGATWLEIQAKTCKMWQKLRKFTEKTQNWWFLKPLNLQNPWFYLGKTMVFANSTFRGKFAENAVFKPFGASKCF